MAWISRKLDVSKFALVLLGLLSTTAYCKYLGESLRFPDEHDYINIATSISGRGIFSLDGQNPTAYRPPGWPLTLALFMKLGFGVRELRFLNVLLLSLAAVAFHAIAKRFLSPRTSLMATTAMVFYPITIFTLGTFYPQTLALALVVSATLLAIHCKESPRSLTKALLLGVCLGFLTLTVPPMGILAPVMVFWLRRQGLAWSRLFAVVMTTLILVLLWITRNFIAFHKFILLSTNTGTNLLLGNSSKTHWRSGVMVDLSEYQQHIRDLNLNEVDADAYMRQQALLWIAHNPFDAVALYLGKLLNFFSPFDTLATKSQTSVLTAILSSISYVPILALAISRLMQRKTFPEERLLVALYLVFAITSAVFFTRIRFRAPLDWMLILMSFNYLVSPKHQFPHRVRGLHRFWPAHFRSRRVHERPSPQVSET